MVQRLGGARRKTRTKFAKDTRRRGKISIRQTLQAFAAGERVTLSAEPAVQSGMYHRRHHGKAGVVEGMQGECYVVRVRDGNAVKRLLIHPVHLRRSA